MIRTVALLVLAAVLLALAFTNPDRDAFASAFAERAGTEIAAELELTGPLGAALSGAGRAVVEAALRDQVVRRDYLVASTYTLPAGGEDPVYLGIAGTFLQLRGP
ncbi:MAG: hypothetical protein WD336_01500 [Trueperaceae bacterium]